MDNIETKIEKLGIILDNPANPVANFVPAVTSGKLIFLSGQGPMKNDGSYMKGKLGKDLSIDEGYEAAKLVCIQLLAALKKQIGDLNKVKKIVKVLGLVNADLEFENHPNVINGCSDLLVEIFGDRGKHARSAIGVGSLPFQIPVEIEMIVEIK
ncbi:MAG: RidA family protein [Dehalococcoidia bacterium]